MEQEKVFKELGRDFPLISRPFLEIGERIGLNERDVLHVVRMGIEHERLKRISAIFDYNSLGYRGTLFGCEVEPDSLEEVSSAINDFNGVTHNYERDFRINLWFTFLFREEEEKERLKETLKRFSSIRSFYDLPSIRTFKIKVDFSGAEYQNGWMTEIPHTPSSISIELDDKDKTLIRLLSEGLPITEMPFKSLSETVGLDERVILDKLKGWIERGIIRRVGPVFDHLKIGIEGNIMVVMRPVEGRMDEVGNALSRSRQISHCFLRRVPADFPYPLFAMFHAVTMEECERVIERVLSALPIEDKLLLRSIKELKKTPMIYFESS